MRLTKWVLLLMSFFILSCCYSKEARDKETQEQTVEARRDTISYRQLGRIDGERLLIEHDVNLNGSVCVIPRGLTLCARGGVIRQGVLVGNGTVIEAKKAIFDRMTIKGRWNVPKITTKFFANLKYENSLRDVVALASPSVKNVIEIEKGDYLVKAEKSGDACVSLCSNTELVLKGTIRLLPNDYKSYHIICAKGKNIVINGNGTVIGDKSSHTGTEGEWGMGITFKGAVNASVKGLTIRDCWGDCIYVGGRSKNVLIENCKIDNGRRQGISVTKADSVTIRKCRITNVSGTNPQYAIDVEPNKKDSVDNVLIENVAMIDCEGGLLVVHAAPKDGATTPWTGNVTMRNCDVKCKSKHPVRVVRCENVRIEKCNLYAPNGLSAVTVTRVGEAIVENNRISVYSGLMDRAKNELRELVGKGRRNPIDIRNTEKDIVKNNKIVSER